ncbi:MAG: endolytic transglycosylase MltG [bacterium]|nr:endolytic transglycosylase MltG [bacterium]
MEGWSIYDVDADLSQKDFISKGDYLSSVLSRDRIRKYQEKYVFLSGINLLSLEGFLYPDTYYLDKSQDFIPQLLTLQLNTFDKKIWKPSQDKIGTLLINIQHDYSLHLSFYDLLKLASVVEKEERNPVNKPIVFGIFLNRLQKGMRLDADITLCYGLKEPYESCKPTIIVKHLHDTDNLFNTRVHNGLPPQPISSVSQETWNALFHYKKTDYLYYLHDTKGNIHYGKTV